MLSQAPSLARRAALVFGLVYAAILLAVLTLNAAANWIDRGQGNLRGPSLAVDYADAELRWSNGRYSLAANGRYAELAARNPALWLIVLRDGRAFTLGAVPPAALTTVKQLQTVVGVAMFRLPSQVMPLGAVSVQRREHASGSILLAAGGVDPTTLSLWEAVDMLLNPGVMIMLAVIGAISLLAMLFAVPAFSRALRPITRGAERIGPADAGRRLDPRAAPRELHPLVAAFNVALDRLEVELGRRRRFIADVAHELRTPLSVLSLKVDALPDAVAKAELRRSLSGLSHLVTQMLDLERLSLSTCRRLSVDLTEIARNVVADLAPLAISRGYDLVLSAPEERTIALAEAQAIERALTNVISNAIHHGGDQGQITVQVSADRTIDVVDEGPGIADTLRPRLFEPFTRGDASVHGSGLGLHITREIMRAHGGDIVNLPQLRGARFQISFPPATMA